jgi:ferredoxin
VRVAVDEGNCSGTGLCARICEEVFEIREGVSRVRMDCVPEELESKVAKAARLCPLQAIEVTS